MANKLSMKTLLASLGAIGLMLSLSGCGTNSSAKSSSSSSSTTTADTSSTQAYNKANKQIAKEDYSSAQSTLDNCKNPSSKVSGLSSSLSQFVSAKKDYDSANYDSAEQKLNKLKKNDTQTSSALKTEISKLDGQIQDAQSSSSSSASTASSASATSTDQNTVISNFASAAGFYGKSGYTFNIDSQNGSTYTIEVRQNNSDGSVSNMVGIYNYDASTGNYSSAY